MFLWTFSLHLSLTFSMHFPAPFFFFIIFSRLSHITHHFRFPASHFIFLFNCFLHLLIYFSSTFYSTFSRLSLFSLPYITRFNFSIHFLTLFYILLFFYLPSSLSFSISSVPFLLFSLHFLSLFSYSICWN